MARSTARAHARADADGEPGHDDQNLRMKATAEGLNEKKFQACLADGRYDASIRQATDQGRSLGVSGTPTAMGASAAGRVDAPHWAPEA